MALEKKIIGLPIAKGQNEKISEKVLPLGQFEEAKNIQFVKEGEARKRKGFHSISNTVPALSTGDSASTVSVGKALASFGDETLAFDGRYGYTKTSTSDTWVNKGTILGCTLAGESVEANTNFVQTPTQIAQSNNFEVQVWSEFDPSEEPSRVVSFTGVTPKAPKVIGVINQTVGSGLSDLTTSGTFTGTGRRLYEVVIEDDSTSPELFKWRYQDDGGAWSSFSTGHNCGYPRTLNLGVTVTPAAQTGHTTNDAWQFYGGYGAVDCTGATDHNFSKGTTATMAFAHADWPDADFVVTATPSTSSFTLDFSQNAAPDAATAGTATVQLGSTQAWRTYAKVVDKTTRAEVVGKTLVNEFSSSNNIHNVPRAQVLAISNFVYIFVHVGSGRVKHTLLNTADGVSPTLIPGLLTNSSSGVTFEVDREYPHWHVAPTNYIAGASANGFVLLRRLDDTSQTLRLSTWKANASTGALTGTGYGEQASPSPVSINDPVFFRDPNFSTLLHTAEYYVNIAEHLEVAGGLMLSVIKSGSGTNDIYICIGYTKAGDKTSASGTDDEPVGVYLSVYDSNLLAVNAGQLVQVDGATSAYVDTNNSGYVLVNGTAGSSARGVDQDKVRFFLTLVKNVTGRYARSQPHRVNAYDVEVGGGSGITDKSFNIHWATVASDTFYYNSDFYLTLGYATRHNELGGKVEINEFNNSVSLLVNHNGEVVAKSSNGAGCLAQDINFRYLTNRTTSDAGATVQQRFNVSQCLPRVVSESSTTFRFGSSKYSGVKINDDGTDVTGLDASINYVDMDPARYLPSVDANGSLTLGGGILWNYAGDFFKEENFFWWPELHSIAVDALSNGVDVGKHLWCAIYEWKDKHGKVQRSNPSYPVEYTIVSATRKVTIKVYNLTLTYKGDVSGILTPGGVAAVQWGKRTPPKIVLYRTKVGGSVFHRCAEREMDTTSGHTNIEDTLPDAELIDNPTLYTTGGVAGNISPPSQYDIALFKDRVFLATTENTVWFSKRFQENRATGFSDSFIRSVDNRAEKINAVCPNQEHMLILGEKNGYYLSGDGPSSTGAGPGFSPLRIFAPGQGTIEGSCRVESPAGVFFQTAQGLMLCGKNMQVSYKGANVEDLVTSSNYASAAQVFDKEHEVRFMLEGNKKIAVYNYLFDRWSHWELHADTGTNAATAVINNTYYRLNTIGVLYEQQTGTYYDKVSTTNKPYNFSLTTGWLNIGQLQQVGRVYRLLLLGDYNTSSLPYVVFYSDYNKSYHHQITYPTTGPGTNKYQLHVKFPRQKIKSTRFTISESTPVAGGGYMAIQSMALLVGVKKPETSFKHATADHLSSVLLP